MSVQKKLLKETLPNQSKQKKMILLHKTGIDLYSYIQKKNTESFHLLRVLHFMSSTPDVLFFSCQESSGLLARLFVLDYRDSLSTTLGQSLYLPIMFSFFGLTAGIVYWEAGTPLHVITAYCGASMPSLLFLGSVIVNRINRSLEVSLKKNSSSQAQWAGLPLTK